MTNKTTLIKSNSNLIQPFVVHPDCTTLSKEKILEMQQSSEILKENACAILEVNVNNLDKMQEDFVIPKGSVVNYGGGFKPLLMNDDWVNPATKDSPRGTWFFNTLKQEYSDQTITIVIPIEPQKGSDFCFKGDKYSQDFKQAWFQDGFRGPLEVLHGKVYDGRFIAPFCSLNLLPFGLEIPENGAKENKAGISLQDTYAEAEDNALAAQAEANKLSEIREALYQIGIEVDKLKTFGIEVEVKIKK